MEKITSIKKRLLQVAKNKGISYEIFFKEFGTTYANFKGKSLNSSLRSNVLVEFSTKYPDIDLHWLITGSPKKEEKEENTQKLDTMKKDTKNYKQMYYEQLDKNMLLHEKLLACMEGDSFSKDVG